MTRRPQPQPCSPSQLPASFPPSLIKSLGQPLRNVKAELHSREETSGEKYWPSRCPHPRDLWWPMWACSSLLRPREAGIRKSWGQGWGKPVGLACLVDRPQPH